MNERLDAVRRPPPFELLPNPARFAADEIGTP